MRAWVAPRYGPPEVLRLADLPDPVPGPGRSLVRVRAIGLNFADCAARLGVYPRVPKPPFVPGMEVSGEVVALGEGVVGTAAGHPGRCGADLRRPRRAGPGAGALRSRAAAERGLRRPGPRSP